MFVLGHKCLLARRYPRQLYPFERLTSTKEFEKLTSTSSLKGVDFTFSIRVTKQTSVSVLWKFTEGGKSARFSGVKIMAGPSLSLPVNISFNRPEKFLDKQYNVWPW